MSITAISPLDGRYESKVSELQDAFSEFSLVRARVTVEVLLDYYDNAGCGD